MYQERDIHFSMPIPQDELLEAVLVLCQAIKDELSVVKEQVEDLLAEITNDADSAYSGASQFVDLEASDEDMDDCTPGEEKSED